VNEGFKKFLSASEKDRADTFLAASQRLGANVQYVEKDFWVCWTLDVLYHGLPAGVVGVEGYARGAGGPARQIEPTT
jgi:hypothetical protein